MRSNRLGAMPVWDDIDDAQVLQLAQDGDPEAFGELYERYAKIIFRFLYSHLYDRLDAEDLTEEVFLRALGATKVKKEGIQQQSSFFP